MNRKLNQTLLLLMLLLLTANAAQAQRFFNLTAQQVKIDSLLPRFCHAFPLPDNYQDSIYTVSIAYPEYIDMSANDQRLYKQITQTPLPTMPQIEQQIVLDRKKAALEVSFIPLVNQDKPKIMVSFMLSIKAKAKKRSLRRANLQQAQAQAMRYADNSVLATGKWAKIRVAQTGVHQLTADVIKKAGFNDLSKIHIYGYGGALQNEQLEGNELQQTDDLKEVATYNANGKILFHAQGPVSWKTPTTNTRTRNPYSDYGYYFITQTEEPTLEVDSATFVSAFYPSNNDYHELHEVDNYAWMQGGRNLFESTPINAGESHTFTLNTNRQDTNGTIAVAITAGQTTQATVELNEQSIGTANITWSSSTYDSYDQAKETTLTAKVSNLNENNNIKISTTRGGPVRLDYISITYDTPKKEPQLTHDTFPTAEYTYNITNQNHHADTAADMVIIIPTSQKLLTQAQRLATFHQQNDGLRVNIVPADELYNEFASGTPDANAYRRYLKMLYDRAQTDADLPRYLLLFGDCAWDNRMNTTDWKNDDPDNYLLCFESENSFNKVYCYVDDGWFGLLDDGEGLNPMSRDKLDLAIGRIPVTTEQNAKIVVDKIINYANNTNPGAWQNTLVFMGDDGNSNLHMRDENDVAEFINQLYPNYLIKKIMWDTFKREDTPTGHTYPDVTKTIKQYQTNGALIMDYAGHGAAHQISHESVLQLSDFENFTNTNLPLWITASCDIMPFDGNINNIGEAALLNKNGGAIAFFGTTRTVYANYNKVINQAYLQYVLSTTDGKPTTLGEAQRLAKNALISTGQDRTENKLQYSLLGDPAMSLHLPTEQIVIDEINGVNIASTTDYPTLKAGSTATIKGHIAGQDAFNGIVTATIRDTEELITCRQNDKYDGDGAENPFTFYDRTKTLFSGSNNVVNGQFDFTFAVPKDINYADDWGMINLYAVNNEHNIMANGVSTDFIIGGSSLDNGNLIGPSIYCYLNSPSFTNGGNVNTTPYFVANIADNDGINATGNGIGHDMELIIDGQLNKTYILNDNFTFDFGSYTSGSTWYNIPELEPGPHKLLFRAWDILNNSSATELDFNVVKGLEPVLYSVGVTNNPASTSTTFIINHDRTGGSIDVEINVYDLAGRPMWNHHANGVSTVGAYTVDWDLSVSNGSRLPTGVYIYRVSISSDGSKQTSKAKKLIVLSNN